MTEDLRIQDAPDDLIEYHWAGIASGIVHHPIAWTVEEVRTEAKRRGFNTHPNRAERREMGRFFERNSRTVRHPN